MLKDLLSSCDFGNKENLTLRDKLLFGILDERVKKRMLRKPELTLGKGVDILSCPESTYP